MTFTHEPVLLEEVIKLLEVREKQWYVDATFGGGGYTEALLIKGAQVISLDADQQAILRGKNRFGTRKNWIGIWSNFRNIEMVVREITNEDIAGVVFDIGLSSIQLDDPLRGFSFQKDSALDMRFDSSSGMTAKYIVNNYSEELLYDIIATYGEEERARSIAHAICRARVISPIETTFGLKAIIEKAISGEDKTCFSKVFQAIRIEVNDELQSIQQGIDGAYNILGSGGRIAVVSFHSLEDRIVKRNFINAKFRQVTKKPIEASEEEIIKNRRSRSAKLRVAEKI